MNYISKAPASRIIRGQVLTWPGTGTVISTNFGLGVGGPSIHHIRVISQINGWVTIDSTNPGTALSTTTFVPGTFIAANTANGDYFAARSGEIMTFTSTTTTSGVLVSCAEMG